MFFLNSSTSAVLPLSSKCLMTFFMSKPVSTSLWFRTRSTPLCELDSSPSAASSAEALDPASLMSSAARVMCFPYTSYMQLSTNFMG